MKKYDHPRITVKSFKGENIMTESATGSSVPVDTIGDTSQYKSIYNIDYLNLEDLF